LPRRRLLRARGQPGRAGRGARGGRRGPGDADRRGELGAAPGVRHHRRGQAQGVLRADRAVPRAAGGGMTDLRERVAATGLLEAGRPVVVLLSGGRDSVCLLDLATTLAGPGAVRALHVNYGLRAEADGDEAHCVALCRALGVALDVHRAGRPDDAPGNLQAWARDVRYAEAARRAAVAGPAA